MERIFWMYFFAFVAILTGALYLYLDHADRKRRRLRRLMEGGPAGLPEPGWYERVLSRLEVELQRAGIRMGAREYVRVLAAGMAAGFLAAWIVLVHLAPAARVLASMIGAVACGYAVPRLYVRWRAERRRQMLIKQLMDTIILLNQSVQAGNSVLVAFQHAAEQLPPPMKEEIEQLLRDARAYDLSDALQRMDERIGHPTFSLVAQALIVQEETGGSAVPVLARAIELIAEREEVARAVEVHSAEGRITLVALAAMPPAFLLLFSSAAPELTEPLFGTRAGFVVLGIMALLYVVGILWARRVVDVRRIVGD